MQQELICVERNDSDKSTQVSSNEDMSGILPTIDVCGKKKEGGSFDHSRDQSNGIENWENPRHFVDKQLSRK